MWVSCPCCLYDLSGHLSHDTAANATSWPLDIASAEPNIAQIIIYIETCSTAAKHDGTLANVASSPLDIASAEPNIAQIIIYIGMLKSAAQ